MDTEKESRNNDSTGGPAAAGRNISYFSLTAGGSLLALRLRDEFGGTAHLPRCHSLGCSRCDPFDNLAEALPERFRAGDTLICIMAAGIVFRILGPFLQAKQSDPAVIVLDEDGRFVIPLLGGHAAGANALSRKIARFLGAGAAITTSSDVQGLVAPDEVADLLGAAIADPVDLRRVSALIVDRRPVCIESPTDPGIEGYGWTPPGGSLEGYKGRLLVTHLAQPGEGRADERDPRHEREADGGKNLRSKAPVTARLVPRVVAAGIGCKRGTATDEISSAIRDACAGAGMDPLAIGTLASIDIKSDEPGLQEAAAKLGVPLVLFAADELAAVGSPGSAFVEEAVGTPAVCEPAALLAAGDGASLLSDKQKLDGVTVALALSVKPLGVAGERSTRETTDEGMVIVVGTGAGTAPLLTAEASQAIAAADTVFGYRTYIKQIESLFPGKEFVTGSMGAETERCREALDLAEQGHKVAMISSGDPGVYGMAGPVLEMANGVPVAVIPGVTSAQIAAARLGAPLMNDYITLSLSDLLTPREEVLRRAESAASSDLVICLYNPTSHKRQPLFEEVCGILAKHRPAATLVGWVRDAGGPEEEVHLIELGALAAQPIDMRTIVIVGNSRTELVGGRMVTRRGYRDV